MSGPLSSRNRMSLFIWAACACVVLLAPVSFHMLQRRSCDEQVAATLGLEIKLQSMPQFSNITLMATVSIRTFELGSSRFVWWRKFRGISVFGNVQSESGLEELKQFLIGENAEILSWHVEVVEKMREATRTDGL